MTLVLLLVQSRLTDNIFGGREVDCVFTDHTAHEVTECLGQDAFQKGGACLQGMHCRLPTLHALREALSRRFTVDLATPLRHAVRHCQHTTLQLLLRHAAY